MLYASLVFLTSMGFVVYRNWSHIGEHRIGNKAQHHVPYSERVMYVPRHSVKPSENTLTWKYVFRTTRVFELFVIPTEKSYA